MGYYNKYNPKSKEPFKLSRSKIDDFLNMKGGFVVHFILPIKWYVAFLRECSHVFLEGWYRVYF